MQKITASFLSMLLITLSLLTMNSWGSEANHPLTVSECLGEDHCLKHEMLPLKRETTVNGDSLNEGVTLFVVLPIVSADNSDIVSNCLDSEQPPVVLTELKFDMDKSLLLMSKVEIQEDTAEHGLIADQDSLHNYYLAKLAPLLAEYGMNWLLYSSAPDGRVNLGSGYSGHFTHTQTLSEDLYFGSLINSTLADHGLSLTSDTELDTALLSTGVLLTTCIANRNWVIDKKRASHGAAFLMMLSKVPANMMTKVGNRYFQQFYEGAEKSYQKIYSELTTSTTWIATYLLAESLSAGQYQDTYLLTIPAGHCLSCAYSNSGKTLQAYIHHLTGKEKSTAISSHLASAGTQVALSVPVIYYLKKRNSKTIAFVFVTTSAGHIFKGAAYALAGAVEETLSSLGYKGTGIDNFALAAAGLLGSVASQYLITLDSGFRTGWSNTYAAHFPFAVYFAALWALN